MLEPELQRKLEALRKHSISQMTELFWKDFLEYQIDKKNKDETVIKEQMDDAIKFLSLDISEAKRNEQLEVIRQKAAKDTSSKVVGYRFDKNKPALKTRESTFIQTHISLQDLHNYLTPENQAKHHITNIAVKKDGINTLSELEMSFDNPGSSPLKVFVNNGPTPHSIQVSTTKGLSPENFQLVAMKAATLAVARASPGAEFDLTCCSDENKRESLSKAFEEAIAKAIQEPHPRFTEQTKPHIKIKLNLTPRASSP